MMNIFKEPWGLLGLFGIIALIIIYIIKQNHQQKIISSTYVWRLSLKYRKSRLPINKFRNILIFICQLLAIVACALIMAWPIIEGDAETMGKEKILIIDASAGMLAQQEDSTRFERAVSEVRSTGKQTIDEGGAITVILAGKKAEYIIVRTESVDELNASLNPLVDKNDLKCTFGEADVEGAMALAESVLVENSLSKVLFFTGTNYVNKGNVQVVNVSNEDWNVAVLDIKTTIIENYYIFDVEVASYNANSEFSVYLEIRGARYNIDGMEIGPATLKENKSVTCTGGISQIASFKGLNIISFEEVYAYVLEADSFYYDNSFYLYGNKKEIINVLYSSSKPNDFMYGALMALRAVIDTRFAIELVQNIPKNNEYITTGFDFYVYEHDIPPELPTDGAVLVVNPDKTSSNLGVIIGNETGEKTDVNYLTAASDDHPLLNFINCERIMLTIYRKVLSYPEFEPIIMCGDDPVFLVKKELNSRIAVMLFSVHFSDIPVLLELPVLMLNLFNYFLPSTITQFVYDVDDTVNLNMRGVEIELSGPGIDSSTDNTTTEFQTLLTVNQPGTYTIDQELISGLLAKQTIFVKINRNQSNFARMELELANPYVDKKVGLPDSLDLTVFVASTLVALLFLEWFLHSREQI